MGKCQREGREGEGAGDKTKDSGTPQPSGWVSPRVPLWDFPSCRLRTQGTVVFAQSLLPAGAWKPPEARAAWAVDHAKGIH